MREGSDFQDYEEAVDLYNKNGQPKAWRTKLDRMQTRMYNAAKAELTGERQQALRRENTALQKIDAQPLDPLRSANLDQQIDTELQAYDKRVYQPGLTGDNMAEAHLAAERRSASPLGDPDDKAGTSRTMRPDQFNRVVRNVISLNRDKIGTPDAVDLVMQMASPVREGQTGFNGLRGRAGAQYTPLAVDAVGNYLVKTQMGTFRISPDDYAALKKARGLGWDRAKQYQGRLQTRRDEAAKPSLPERAFDWGMRQLQ